MAERKRARPRHERRRAAPRRSAPSEATERTDAPGEYSPQAIAVRPIAAVAAGIVAVIGIALVAARFVAGGIAEPAVTPGPVRTAEPPLQPHPARDLAAYRAEKERQLESYGWVDRDHGIAHIPIERAMALYAQQRQQPEKAGR